MISNLSFKSCARGKKAESIGECSQMQYAGFFDPTLIGFGFGDLWTQSSTGGEPNSGDRMLYEGFSGPNASKLNFWTRVGRHATPLEPLLKGDSLLRDSLLCLIPGIILLCMLLFR